MELDFLILSELRFRDSLISKLGLTGIPFFDLFGKEKQNDLGSPGPPTESAWLLGFIACGADDKTLSLHLSTHIRRKAKIATKIALQRGTQ